MDRELHFHKLYALFEMVKYVNSLEGETAEVGVLVGNSAKIIAEAVNGSKELHLFDTFAQKLPDDYFQSDEGGDERWLVDSTRAREQLSGYEKVFFYEGMFEETCHMIENKKFCFVHIDCDYYNSITACADFFFPRLVDGGMALFDDYGAVDQPGAKRAVDQFFEDNKAYTQFGTLRPSCAGGKFYIKGKVHA